MGTNHTKVKYSSSPTRDCGYKGVENLRLAQILSGVPSWRSYTPLENMGYNARYIRYINYLIDLGTCRVLLLSLLLDGPLSRGVILGAYTSDMYNISA